MGETTYAGGKQFSGDDKGRGVGTEVEEELETRNQHSTPASSTETIETYLGNGEADEFPSRP